MGPVAAFEFEHFADSLTHAAFEAFGPDDVPMS